MKKHLILLLLTGLFTLSSCSSDDNNIEIEENAHLIIGTWNVVAMDPMEINITACEQPSTITLNEDNSGYATLYLIEAECIPASAEAEWSRDGNEVYFLTIPLLGKISGTVEFSGDNKFFFTAENGTTITFERQV